MINTMDNDIKYGRQELPPIEKPIKTVEKYWGDMKTLFENDMYTVKRIFMRKGTQSSMEYHISKKEAYFIESGKLKVVLELEELKTLLSHLRREMCFTYQLALCT